MRHLSLAENIRYNANTLCVLARENDFGVFNKLIVIQIASILEAALGEIISRARDSGDQTIPNFTEQERKDIRGEEIGTFERIINVHKKYETLNSLGGNIYGDLHEIRTARNKIHLGFQKCDNFFVDSLIEKAMDVNHRVLECLEKDFFHPQDDQIIYFSIPVK